MKKISYLEADRFWDFFDEKYPELSILLSYKGFQNGAITANPSAKMKDEDWKQFEVILAKWLVENGYANNGQPEIVYAITNKKTLAVFSIDSITSIEPIDKFTTQIKFKEDRGTITTIEVDENSEVFKNRLNV